MSKYIRKCGKITDQFLIAWLITFVLLAAGQIIGLIPAQILQMSAPPWLSIALSYLTFTGIWITGIAAMSFKDNKPMLETLTPRFPGNTLKWILIGSAVGFGSNAACAGLSVLLKDIGLSFACFEPLKLLVILFAVFVQSGAEELLCRCYLLQKLARRYKNIWFAMIGNSLLFVLLHLGNSGINFWGYMELLIMGIVTSFFVIYYRSVWAAMFMHTLWNYTQNIIFGLPNSGVVSPYSIFRLDAASTGLFFDPGFGIEGSPGACLILLIITGLMWLDIRRKKLPPLDLWKEAEEKTEQAALAKPEA